MSSTATKKGTKSKGQSNGSATITASQAKQLLEAEALVRKLRAELEAAEHEREELRSRLRSRLPFSSKREEKEKRIRTARVGDVSIRVTPARSGERFNLRDYREAGHEITPEMREAITPGKKYDRWTVKASS